LILTENEIDMFPSLKEKLFDLRVQIPLWLKKNGCFTFLIIKHLRFIRVKINKKELNHDNSSNQKILCKRRNRAQNGK